MTNPRGLLLDIDGVLVVSERPIEGAVEAFTRLRDAQIPIRLVTNTTTSSRASLAAMLRRGGFEVDARELVTAPTATASFLRAHHAGESCFLIAKGDVVEDFEGVDLVESDAGVVVIGGAEEEFTYDRLNRAFRMLDAGAALIAMHRNRSWLTDEGLKLDAGPFVTALEEAAGVEAHIVGKPSADFFESALRILGTAPGDAMMVGDDLHNDVLAAQALGLTGVQVRTGKFREDHLAGLDELPDLVIDSFADLPNLLTANG